MTLDGLGARYGQLWKGGREVNYPPGLKLF